MKGGRWGSRWRDEEEGGGAEGEDGMLRSVVQQDGCCRQDLLVCLFIFQSVPSVCEITAELVSSQRCEQQLSVSSLTCSRPESLLCPGLEQQSTNH